MRTIIISFLILISGALAQAIPIMDTATGTGDFNISTVVPDDKVPNLYYFFPSHYGLSVSDVTKKPLFSYIEKSQGWFRDPIGYVNTIFEAFVSPNLKTKIAEVKAANPNAKFAPIPIQSAHVLPHKVFNILLSNIQCQDQGNMIGQQIGCVWQVDPENRRSFQKTVRSNVLVQVLEYNYSFLGSVLGKPQMFNHSIAVYFSDLISADFFDSEGRRIEP